MLFPRTFFYVISLIEKPTLFPLTFIDVIFMVKKSRIQSNLHVLFSTNGKKFDAVFGKVQANERTQGGFPLLVTLKG